MLAFTLEWCSRDVGADTKQVCGCASVRKPWGTYGARARLGCAGLGRKFRPLECRLLADGRGYASSNSALEMPRLRIILSRVPCLRSRLPWRGMGEVAPVRSLAHISWLPRAWRTNTQPSLLSLRVSSRWVKRRSPEPSVGLSGRSPYPTAILRAAVRSPALRRSVWLPPPRFRESRWSLRGCPPTRRSWGKQAFPPCTCPVR